MKESNEKYHSKTKTKKKIKRKRKISKSTVSKIKNKDNKNIINYKVTWYMKKLNNIEINHQEKLELIALGGSNNNIILLNAINLKVYQILENHDATVYSLEQYKDSPILLFSSSEDETVNIYKLNNKNKYELIQKLKKSEEKNGGEINKVIILSNKLLVTGDHKSVTIWKNEQENKINYKEFQEIIINRNTCHLLEVNPSLFVVTQYHNFQVYKNDEKEFPLLGELNLSSHGSSSNGLCKINDNIICCGGDYVFTIISIVPLQVILKIPLNSIVYFTYVTKNNYIYCKDKNCFIQFKIIKDDENNFLEIKKIGEYTLREKNFYSVSKAILPFDDGRIFFIEEQENYEFYHIIV